MTTLQETFAADFEEEERLREVELGIGNKKRIIPEVHSQHFIQDPAPEPKSCGLAISKMLKHNQEAKKKKLIKNVKHSERHQWKM